jgi:hypothetical protein
MVAVSVMLTVLLLPTEGIDINLMTLLPLQY